MTAPAVANDPRCPTCQGPMYDERKSKFWGNGLTSNGKQKPIFKCKDKACGGVIWPPRNAATSAPPAAAPPSYGEMPEVDEPRVDEAQARIDKLNKTFAFYRVCFDEALKLGEKASKAGFIVDMSGVNAAAATLFIGCKERGLI